MDSTSPSPTLPPTGELTPPGSSRSRSWLIVVLIVIALLVLAAAWYGQRALLPTDEAAVLTEESAEDVVSDERFPEVSAKCDSVKPEDRDLCLLTVRCQEEADACAALCPGGMNTIEACLELCVEQYQICTG